MGKPELIEYLSSRVGRLVMVSKPRGIPSSGQHKLWARLFGRPLFAWAPWKGQGTGYLRSQGRYDNWGIVLRVAVILVKTLGQHPPVTWEQWDWVCSEPTISHCHKDIKFKDVPGSLELLLGETIGHEPWDSVVWHTQSLSPWLGNSSQGGVAPERTLGPHPAMTLNWWMSMHVWVHGCSQLQRHKTHILAGPDGRFVVGLNSMKSVEFGTYRSGNGLTWRIDWRKGTMTLQN